MVGEPRPVRIVVECATMRFNAGSSGRPATFAHGSVISAFNASAAVPRQFSVIYRIPGHLQCPGSNAPVAALRMRPAKTLGAGNTATRKAFEQRRRLLQSPELSLPPTTVRIGLHKRPKRGQRVADLATGGI